MSAQRHPSQDQTNAISTFCACKQKLSHLEKEKHSIVNPLLNQEEQTKVHLLNSMNHHNLSCVPLRNFKDRNGNSYYLVKKTLTSNRTITKDRIKEGLDSLEIRHDEVFSLNNLDKVNNEIYNSVRNICVIQKPTVSVTVSPPKSFLSDKKSPSRLSQDLLICQNDPELHQILEKNVTILTNCQIQIKNTRDKYNVQKKNLKEQKENTEKYVIQYLQTQPDKKRKLRFTSGAESNTMTLQCRNLTTTSHTKHIGLRNFKNFLDISLQELLVTKNSWKELKPILIQRLMDHMEKFEHQHEKKTQSQKIYLCKTPCK